MLTRKIHLACTIHEDNVTTSMVGLKKKVTYAKISPKMESPGDTAGNAEEEEEVVHVSLTWIKNWFRLVHINSG